MKDEKLDLTPLDPAADPLRWERRIRQVAARAAEGAARRRPGALFVQLAAWVRPALACAAAAAIAAWIPAWLPRAPAPAQVAAAPVDRMARLLAWADGEQPVNVALLSALEDDDDAR